MARLDDTYTRAVGDWWSAVMKELWTLPPRQFPDLPIGEAAKLKLAQAMDLARDRGAVEP